MKLFDPNPNEAYDGPVYAGLTYVPRGSDPIPAYPVNFRHVDSLAAFGTHFPVLASVLSYLREHTPNPRILEHGCGFFSTFLMRTMFPKAEIVSVDSSEDWVKVFHPVECPLHKTIYHPAKEKFPDFPGPWDLVFVDGNPCEDRLRFALELTSKPRFMVVHDFEQPGYGWANLPSFKYTYTFKYLFPWTGVLSDEVDPATFLP